MLVLSVLVGVMRRGGGPQDTRGLRTNLNEPITWIIIIITIIMRGSQNYVGVGDLVTIMRSVSPMQISLAEINEKI